MLLLKDLDLEVALGERYGHHEATDSTSCDEYLHRFFCDTVKDRDISAPPLQRGRVGREGEVLACARDTSS